MLIKAHTSVASWHLKLQQCGVDYFLRGWGTVNGPFRQYFSLYRAVSQREGGTEKEERNDRREKKCQGNPNSHLLLVQ